MMKITDQKTLIEVGEKSIERIERQKSSSKQPRLQEDADKFFGSVFNWVTDEGLDEPPYGENTSTRDTWLRNFWKKETHLAGVLNSVILIDANRGWKMLGGRNQVIKYTRIIHNLEDGEGWRTFMRLQADAFRTADIGAITEIGRQGKRGPMRSLFYVDPTRCVLSGQRKTPLIYNPPKGDPQAWSPLDFFRVVSMPSTDETLHKLGYCAVSRAIEIAKTMIAIFQHDHEMLAAAAPRGLLLLKNIRQDQWEDAMAARDAKMASLEQRHYGAVAVLATEGIDSVEAVLVALSTLPKDFNRKEFTDLMMYAYALVMGYSPDEFWPVSTGALGRGTETAIQHRKATTKGVLDFSFSFQEKFQNLLPDTLQFEFEERDVAGEMEDIEVQSATAKVISDMYIAGLREVGEGLITREEARSLLAQSEIIPQDWTEKEEKAISTDTASAETRYRENVRVQRAAEKFPDEPIVEYSWPTNHMVTLWDRGDQMFTRKLHVVLTPKTRQDDEEILYSDPDGEFEITSDDVDQAIDEARRRVGVEFAQLMDNEPMTAEEITDNPVEERGLLTFPGIKEFMQRPIFGGKNDE